MRRVAFPPLVILVGSAFVFAQGKPGAQETGSVQEHVTVERVVVSVRVIDRFANPIPDLAVADFRLRVDGREASLESVEWIREGSRPELQRVVIPGVKSQELPVGAPKTVEQSIDQVHLTGSPRLIVMLFQWEIAGQKDIGFVRMMRQASGFLESARPDDRIAVFGFGSSLRLLQDFTTDRAALAEAIQRIRVLTRKASARPAEGPGLSDAIDRCERTGSIEKAFVCIGKALQGFPGPKTLIFFGWTVNSHRTAWHTEYPAAIEAIEKAQTSVSVLDVSDGWHTLAKGLKMIAYETGGIYQATHDLPDFARLRLELSLEGRYELVFRGPSTDRGWHQLDIELTSRAGTPLFQRWYQN